jgi:carboxymethylenebutenolidase
VLVIQEWWGLVAHIKSVCDRFAAEGFSALAPDMYHGKTANEPDGAGKLFMALNIAQAEKDLRGAAASLRRTRRRRSSARSASAWAASSRCSRRTLNPSVGAAVNFYGIHPNVKPDYSKLSGPVLGLFAEKDGFVTPQVPRTPTPPSRRPASSRRSTSTRTSTTPSSTTRTRRPTTRRRPTTPGAARSATSASI